MNPIEYYKSTGWKVTSPFGERTGTFAGFHRGVDLGGHPCEYPVRTPFSGIVVAARTSGMGTWGNTVCIQLDPDGKYISLNAHLHSISVRAGQRVNRGDIIGTNGGTNHSGANYSCHIHYEILHNNGSAPWRGDVWGDPEKFYLNQGGGSMSDKVIVLNAGHGGRDPGAVANGVRESEAVLPVALYCRDYLNKYYEGHRLVLPRATDKFVSLADRRLLTMREKADLYVSMHMNAFGDSSVGGFETFVYDGRLLPSTIHNQKMLHEEIYKYMSTLGIRDRGMKRSKHWEPTNIPTSVVLVEYLFLTNHREAEFAKDNDKLKEMGVATAKGIVRALNLKRKSVSPTPVPPQPDDGVMWRVVAGSYSYRSNAERVRDELEKLGYSAFLLPFNRT